MTANELMNAELPFLEWEDSCEKAVRFMDEFKLSHYPVVNASRYVGLIYEDDIYALSDWGTPIKEAALKLPPISISADTHFLTVVHRMNHSQLSSIAVVDASGEYMGILTTNAIISVLGNSAFVSDIGGVIEIELASKDYYLTEITRIIESAGLRVLGTYIRNNVEDNTLILTLKLNKQNIDHILIDLDRYGYKVFARYSIVEDDNGIQDRYENLMHYLDL